MAPNPAMSEYNPNYQKPVEAKLPKILLADDNEDIRAMLEQFLKSLSFEVILAEDGERAVALAQQEVPDLILMDLMMPRLSGLEAARKIYDIPAFVQFRLLPFPPFDKTLKLRLRVLFNGTPIWRSPSILLNWKILFRRHFLFVLLEFIK